MRKPLFFIFLLATAVSGFAQVIDKPVATVKLTKNQVITQKQLKQQIEILEKGLNTSLPRDKRKEVLDAMVSEILILQAAERDNVKMSDLEANTMLAQQYKPTLEQAYGPLSDADFKKRMSEQAGMSWDEFFKEFKESLVQQQYITLKKKDVLSKNTVPTEKEIQDFYEANAMQYVNPDIVKFSQIFIDTRTMNADAKEKARKELEALMKDVQTGKSSFNDILVKFSQTPRVNYQIDFTAYLARNDAQKTALLGSTFYQTVFSLKQGETKGVVESKVGFHILSLLEVIPKKFLTLDDRILPDKEMTVREFIRQQRAVENQQKAFKQATLDIVNELKKKAEVKIFEENLNW